MSPAEAQSRFGDATASDSAAAAQPQPQPQAQPRVSLLGRSSKVGLHAHGLVEPAATFLFLSAVVAVKVLFAEAQQQGAFESPVRG